MLHNSKWFDGAPPDLFVKLLVNRLAPAAFSPTDKLIVQGELTTEAYLIHSGEVGIPKLDGEYIRRGAGACVGEVAMVTRGSRASDVVALTYVEARARRSAGLA